MKKQTIMNYMQEGKLLAIYTDAKDSFNIGYIACCFENDCILCSLGSDGSFDGFIRIIYNEIVRIEIDNLYIKKMERLAEHYKSTFYQAQFSGKNAVHALLAFALQNNKIIWAEYDDDADHDNAGYVVSMTDDVVNIHQIDRYGRDSGLCCVEISEFDYLSCDGHDERMLEILASEWNTHTV